MEEFSGFSDVQLQALISPVSDGLKKDGFQAESATVAVALLAQMVLEYRKNRAVLTGGFDLGDFGKLISSALDAIFPPVPIFPATGAAAPAGAPTVNTPTLSKEEIEKSAEWDRTHPTQEETERVAALGDAAQDNGRPKIVSKTRG